MLTVKHARQLANSPDGNRHEANAPDEQERYLRSKSRMINGLMKQFCRLDGPPAGYTQAYAEGWDRIFGKGRADGN